MVGYSKRQEGQCYYNFTESFTDEQWCIALSKVLNDYDFVITVKAVQAKVVSSVSKVQPSVKPVAWALLNQLNDQHNQDQAQIGKEYKEKPTTVPRNCGSILRRFGLFSGFVHSQRTILQGLF